MAASDDDVLDAFRSTRARWTKAVQSHRLAPPDAGFSARLWELALSAAEHARVAEQADERGYGWPGGGRPSETPYELTPGSGRRGPADLWLQFDRAVEELNRVTESRSLKAVAHGYAELARAAEALAIAVEEEDRASGLLPPKKARSGVG